MLIPHTVTDAWTTIHNAGCSVLRERIAPLERAFCNWQFRQAASVSRWKFQWVHYVLIAFSDNSFCSHGDGIEMNLSQIFSSQNQKEDRQPIPTSDRQHSATTDSVQHPDLTKSWVARSKHLWKAGGLSPPPESWDVHCWWVWLQLCSNYWCKISGRQTAVYPPHPERVPRSNMEFLHQSTPLTKTNDVLRFNDNYAATDLAVITS